MYKRKCIGLVLSSTPAYSETFFRSKIIGLKKAGYEVLLFAERNDKNFDLCRVIPNPKVYQFLIFKIISAFLILWRLVLLKPETTYRFYRLELQSARSFREALENLYLNSHILPHRLDWLHFGFATMAIRRENAAKAMGAKMALSLRGYDIAIYPLKHPGCYDLLWQRVDKVHTISDDLLSLAYQNGLSRALPIQKITPAIDANQFQRSVSLPARFKNPLRLLTVARLHWKKGLEHTLEALALLKKAGVTFHYTIVGAGEEYERLAFAAHQLGIREQVEFKGQLPHDAVKAAMQDADIYIQYSISEGFCNAVLEAQGMGLLCIVSDAEGLPENVLHGQTGWVVPKRQPELLFQQILDVTQKSPADLLVIREQAMERTRREFNLEKQQREFVQFYQN